MLGNPYIIGTIVGLVLGVLVCLTIGDKRVSLETENYTLKINHLEQQLEATGKLAGTLAQRQSKLKND